MCLCVCVLCGCSMYVGVQCACVFVGDVCKRGRSVCAWGACVCMCCEGVGADTHMYEATTAGLVWEGLRAGLRFGSSPSQPSLSLPLSVDSHSSSGNLRIEGGFRLSWVYLSSLPRTW